MTAFHVQEIHVASRHRRSPGAARLHERDGIDRLLTSARRVKGGRGPGWVVDAKADAEWCAALRIRPGRRGGWLGRLLGDRHGSPERLRAEWEIREALEAAGVPTPAPVFALARREGLWWRHWLATLDHPDAADGLALLEATLDPSEATTRKAARMDDPERTPRRDPRPGAGFRLAAARAFGRALRRLHDAGVVHGDLHLRNLLFEWSDASTAGDAPAPPRVTCLLIDFDHARRRETVSARERLQDAMRLVRSCEKEGFAATRRMSAAALASYCGGDRALRRAMNEGLPRERRRIARHRLGWRIARTGVLGGRHRRSSHRAKARSVLALGMGMMVALAGLTWLSGCEPGPPPPAANAEGGARLSLLAVGDTGRIRPFARLFEGQHAVARAMAREAERRPIDGLVLLGDNFYTEGLAREDLVERVRANLVAPYCFLLRLDGPRSHEVASACRYGADAIHPTPVYAVLGNHDLETPESPRLQREVVPEFAPGWRMAGGLAQTIPLGEGVDLILFESEPSIDDRDEIRRALGDALRDSEGPWRILATHRPIATDDFGRPRLGGYPQFVLDAIEAAGRPVQLVLAAHHHVLQVFEVDDGAVPSLQLGLGAGARAEPPLASDDHPHVRFRLQALGFARVDLVGRDSDERLVATVFTTPRWPILDRFVRERVVARFAVDRAGRVASLQAEAAR